MPLADIATNHPDTHSAGSTTHNSNSKSKKQKTRSKNKFKKSKSENAEVENISTSQLAKAALGTAVEEPRHPLAFTPEQLQASIEKYRNDPRRGQIRRPVPFGLGRPRQC